MNGALPCEDVIGAGCPATVKRRATRTSRRADTRNEVIMKTLRTRNPLLGVVFVALTDATAHAQRPTAELGASLAGVTIGLGDNRGSTFGIPSSGFGILSPG